MKARKTILTLLMIVLSSSFYAQKIVAFNLSNCDRNTYPDYMYPERLIEKKFVNDTLVMRVATTQNCSFGPRITCRQEQDSLLFSFKNVSDDWSGCLCCYEIELKIAELTDTNFVPYIVSYRGTDELVTRVSKYVFPTLAEINSEEKINQTDSNGLKIGLWHIVDSNSNQLKTKIYYFIDDAGNSRMKWSVSYSKEGKIANITKLKYIDSEGISNVMSIEGEEYFKLKN